MFAALAKLRVLIVHMVEPPLIWYLRTQKIGFLLFLFFLSFFFHMTRLQCDLHAQFEGPSQPDISPSSHDKKEPYFRKIKIQAFFLEFYVFPIR